MITEDGKTKKMCLFCASEYHLEMILLPYIKANIEQTRFVILTQTNLTETMNILLERTNLKEEFKKKVKKINWQNTNINLVNKYHKNGSKICVIINGSMEYIEENNKLLEIYKEIKIINCYNINDKIDVELIKSEYKDILNTKNSSIS